MPSITTQLSTGSMAIRISFLTLHEVLVKVDTDRNPSRSGVDKFAMCQEPRHSRLRVDTLEELRFISEQLKETALSCVQCRCLFLIVSLFDYTLVWYGFSMGRRYRDSDNQSRITLECDTAFQPIRTQNSGLVIEANNIIQSCVF